MMLETVTGQLVDVENPDPASINIEDIAWGLSRISRFCGHTITVIPYNVAQHSLFVANEVEAAGWTAKTLVLQALLHDAAEVYTGDWPSPVKRIPALRPIIKGIESKLMSAIYEAMGLPAPTDEEEAIIKEADMVAQKIEAHAFMPSRGKHWPNMPTVSLERLQQFDQPMSSLGSYKAFIDKFNSLR
jgi:5'-deoxynucleotidase YfbR-like HD superfamily hydrolase